MVGYTFLKISRILELGFRPDIVTKLTFISVAVLLNVRFTQALIVNTT